MFLWWSDYSDHSDHPTTVTTLNLINSSNIIDNYWPDIWRSFVNNEMTAAAASDCQWLI